MHTVLKNISLRNIIFLTETFIQVQVAAWLIAQQAASFFKNPTRAERNILNIFNEVEEFTSHFSLVSLAQASLTSLAELAACGTGTKSN